MQSDLEALRDRHVRILSVLMHLVSLPPLAMLVLTPLAAGRMILFDEAPREDEQLMIVVTFAFTIVLGFYGVGMLAVARGLWKRRRWAPFWAVVVCITWFPLGLAPFAIYGLFALLRPAIYRAWSTPEAPDVQPVATA